MPGFTEKERKNIESANKNTSAANASYLDNKKKSASPQAMLDNRPDALVQRKLNSLSYTYAEYNKPQFGSNVIQRYGRMTEGGANGYTQGVDGAAPQFDFQSQEAVRVENAATSTVRYDMDTSLNNVDAPDMKVSDDHQMALPISDGGESKQFFATAGVVAASNIALAAAGAPLTLNAGAGTITVPALMGPPPLNLSVVTPVLAPGVITASECGVFANEILGVNVQQIELLTGAGGAAVNTAIRPRSPLVGLANRDADLNAALGGADPATIGANENANPNVGEAFGIFARTTVPDPGLIGRFLNNLNILRNYFYDQRTHMQWGEHWAGVVARSGGDFITLENYNRDAIAVDVLLQRLETDYQEVNADGDINAFVAGTANYATVPNEWRYQRLARLGRNYMKFAVQLGNITGAYAGQLQNMWYFEMYGPGVQSFHERWKNSVPNAVTTKVA